jgi:superfamily II DNA helicase RecQ
MSSNIVITDFTRFKAESKYVCTAGLDIKNLMCIRPMPYLNKKFCIDLGIMPGTILRGRFHCIGNSKPHMENHRYSSELTKIDKSSETWFMESLSKTAYKTLNEGFSCEIKSGEKHITTETKPQRSLFTLKIKPENFKLRRATFDGVEKVSADFKDDFNSFYSVAITDYYFYQALLKQGNFTRISKGISQSNNLFLRIGLSQPFKNPNDDRDGFWIQINGVFPFPDNGLIERGYTREPSSPNASSLSDIICDEDLFIQLKRLRLELKMKEKVPAYVIFDDKTLREICRVRPKTFDEFMSISGVGEVKIQKYGDVFLNRLRKLTSQ